MFSALPHAPSRCRDIMASVKQKFFSQYTAHVWHHLIISLSLLHFFRLCFNQRWTEIAAAKDTPDDDSALLFSDSKEPGGGDGEDGGARGTRQCVKRPWHCVGCPVLTLDDSDLSFLSSLPLIVCPPPFLSLPVSWSFLRIFPPLCTSNGPLEQEIVLFWMQVCTQLRLNY